MRASEDVLHVNDIVASEWVAAGAPPSLDHLVGRVVAVEVFQLLCPGCVAHGIPQAKRIRAAFPAEDVAVVGLHSVFEHHAAMTPTVLRAFLSEYGVTFPVAVDAPSEDGDPRPGTMRRFAMRGTPTLLLFDAEGRLAEQMFGASDDVAVGARIAELVAARGPSRRGEVAAPVAAGDCEDGRCSVD